MHLLAFHFFILKSIPKRAASPFVNFAGRRMRKPFYRQLYLGLKEIDTFNVAGCITASIMY